MGSVTEIAGSPIPLAGGRSGGRADSLVSAWRTRSGGHRFRKEPLHNRSSFACARCGVLKSFVAASFPQRHMVECRDRRPIDPISNVELATARTHRIRARRVE